MLPKGLTHDKVERASCQDGAYIYRYRDYFRDYFSSSSSDSSSKQIRRKSYKIVLSPQKSRELLEIKLMTVISMMKN